MKHITKIVALAAIVVVASASLGNVAAAEASPISRANAGEGPELSAIHCVLLEGLGLTTEVRRLLHKRRDLRGSPFRRELDEASRQKAKSYLQLSAFSRSGLIEQLEYEGFMHSQALYGGGATGLELNRADAGNRDKYLPLVA